MIMLALAYIIGAFPTGMLIARAYGVRLDRIGSGNVGATNVSRTLGKGPGILTLVGDLGKGAITVLLARYFATPEIAAGCAVMAVCGHCLSLPPLLKGGKGVATSLGVLIALYPPLALIAVGAFATAMTITKRVSVGSLTAVAAVTAAAHLLHLPSSSQLAVAGMAAVITIRHYQNIRRLLNGTEPPFSFASKSQKHSATANQTADQQETC